MKIENYTNKLCERIGTIEGKIQKTINIKKNNKKKQMRQRDYQKGFHIKCC